MSIPEIGVGLKYEFQDETRSNNDVETSELYHRFAEKIGFRADGWWYHPAFFTFSATLEPELSQVYEEDSVGNTARSNLFTPDYLLSATFLDSKPYTLNLHANRREMPSWAAYKGGFETRIHDFGGDIDLDIQKLLKTSGLYSANLGYSHTDSATKGFYIHEEISDNFSLNLKQQGNKLKTELESFFTDRERTTEDIKSRTKTFDTKLFNNYQIRQNNPIRLGGVWSYRYQELDTLDLETFRLNENLNWRHRRNLTSFYQFNYDYHETNGSDESNIVSLEGRVQHLLFENLTTTAGTQTYYGAYSNGQEAAVDPYLHLLYSRPTPIGSLSLGSRWNYLLTTRDYDNSQSFVSVQNEPHILSFSQDSFLKNYNVAIGSIIVTNTAGTIQYIEGIDYQVELIANYVSIRSLSLGDINNGQAVLVHYLYQQDSEYDDSIFSQHYTFAFTFFRNTTLQLSHSRAKQYIISGTPPNVRRDDNISKASIQHRMSWSDTRFEVATFDRASAGEYQTWQFTQRFDIHPLRRLNLSLAGYYGETHYNDQPIGDTPWVDSESYGGALTANWRLTRRLALSMEGFTNIQESEIEKTKNTGLQAGLSFTYRLWSAKLTYQLSDQSTQNDTNDSSRLRNFIRFDIVRLYW
ncbi:MAG: hypothetical protein K9K37_06065 [Desulfocapsa sp.]|nr:hypothetical protein [Desulfocapsa sp.]